MKESKRKLVKDVAQRINELPEDKKQYILGIMDGIMISNGNTRRDVDQEPENDNAVIPIIPSDVESVQQNA